MIYQQLIRTIQRFCVLVLVPAILSLSCVPLWGQEEENFVYLPVVTKANQPKPVAGPGSTQIQAAGRFSWDETGMTPPVADEAVPPTAVDPNDPKALAPIAGPNRSTIRCTTQHWQQLAAMSSDALRALDSDPAIFPGALVQGGSLLDGQLQQIRGIPRAGGTIYLTNLILDGSSGPSDSKDPLYTRQVTQVSGATINEALQQILSNETLGTAARATYSENVGYSSEQIKFDMGLDADFPSGSFEGSLSVGTDTQKSYTYLMFTQIYYDLIFDSWTGPVSLFAAGENFSDPNDELGPGNPPLFVEKVSYGRQVLYIMESDYAATDVQAAMEAAYNGATADVNFRADLTYRKVMANTRVSYVVRGGDASVALQAIDSATNAERFEKVKASLADKKSANYSSSSPGVPVFYTLRYLDNNGLATMDRAVTYNKRNCIYEAGPGPLDGTEIFVDGQHDKIQIRQTWTGDVDRMRFSLAVAPAITWWKALEIGSRKEFLETENSNRGPIQSLKYTHGDFDPNAPTIPVHFWKAKGFGVHTYLQEKRFNVEDLLGYETHFYWVND